MGKGRRPAPTKIKEARGTARKDRLPKNPVVIDTARPSDNVPVFFKDKGREMYERAVNHLHQMNLLSAVDDTSLELLAMAYQEWHDAEMVLAENGRFYTTYASNGAEVLKPHPAASQSADAWRRIRMMLIEFGLTPASRSKIEIPENKTLDIDDLID